MPKTIIFCADGTWNGPGKDDDKDGIPDPTNVWRLFRDLLGQDNDGTTLLGEEQEIEHVRDGTLVQIAKYLHGVGDSKNPLFSLLGGGFGAGLMTRILRGYTFISRHYEPGDHIVLVGFSRGAYTTRALADFILNKGLLRSAGLTKDEAYRKAGAAWAAYREKKYAKKPGLREFLVDVIDDLPGFFQKKLDDDEFIQTDVTAIGVWDTVGSMGLPSYHQGKRNDVFRFADNVLNDRVKMAFHAVAMDELREDFQPTLWAKRDGIIQTLFPGAHADVGGGYSAQGGHSDLADNALNWMIEQLSGLKDANQNPIISFKTRGPCPIKATGKSHEPWTDFPFNLRGKQVRDFGRDFDVPLNIHTSVLQRVEKIAEYIPTPCKSCENDQRYKQHCCSANL